MTFALQGPEASTLADTIEAAAEGAIQGGGVFAFATKRGIHRLLSIQSIRRLLENNRPFTLIVGTDAITNADALLSLEEFAERYHSLRVLAFVHDRPSTFHPKFCWFVGRQNTQLVVGSGNLTSSGLGGQAIAPPSVGNWEALSHVILTGPEALTTKEEVDGWIAANVASGNLLAVTHEDVRSRGVANSRVQYVRPHRMPRARRGNVPEAKIEEIGAIPEPRPSSVLLREIPQNRSGQADVSKRGLEFFGYDGEAKTVLIQHVGLDNGLGEAVQRRLFQNASQNYRIEIREVAELEDFRGQDDGRTILVAVQLDESAFRYTVVPANHQAYADVSRLLGPIPAAGRRLMRTRILDADALKAGWPTAPTRLFPVVAIALEDTD